MQRSRLRFSAQTAFAVAAAFSWFSGKIMVEKQAGIL